MLRHQLLRHHDCHAESGYDQRAHHDQRRIAGQVGQVDEGQPERRHQRERDGQHHLAAEDVRHRSPGQRPDSARQKEREGDGARLAEGHPPDQL